MCKFINQHHSCYMSLKWNSNAFILMVKQCNVRIPTGMCRCVYIVQVYAAHHKVRENTVLHIESQHLYLQERQSDKICFRHVSREMRLNMQCSDRAWHSTVCDVYMLKISVWYCMLES
jgi:hypothetical protein